MGLSKAEFMTCRTGAGRGGWHAMHYDRSVHGSVAPKHVFRRLNVRIRRLNGNASLGRVCVCAFRVGQSLLGELWHYA